MELPLRPDRHRRPHDRNTGLRTRASTARLHRPGTERIRRNHPRHLEPRLTRPMRRDPRASRQRSTTTSFAYSTGSYGPTRFAPSATGKRYPKVTSAGHYWVEETGLYNPGHGWVFIKYGANAHKYDGYNAFLLYANQAYWNGFQTWLRLQRHHGPWHRLQVRRQRHPRADLSQRRIRDRPQRRR
jgi:hypothetical protein